MNEKWEMCVVSTGTNSKLIYSSHGEQKSIFKSGELGKVICDLLANGWEPFSVDLIPLIYYFRRRIS